MLCFYVFIIIQIVAESFPISSSGHAALFSCIMSQYGMQLPAVTNAVWFNHLLHLPTALIIAIFFRRRWTWLLMRPWYYRAIIMKLIGIVGVADTITVLFYGLFKTVGLHWFPIGVGFICTMCILISLQWCPQPRKRYSPVCIALVLGCAQGISLLPGISRFAITYVCARWLCLNAHRAFYLSWLLQWPLIFVASLHGILGLSLCGLSPELLRQSLGLVIIGATVVAWYGLRLAYRMACMHQLYKWWRYMLIPFSLWVLLCA